jgi:hypothetical protein
MSCCISRKKDISEKDEFKSHLLQDDDITQYDIVFSKAIGETLETAYTEAIEELIFKPIEISIINTIFNKFVMSEHVDFIWEFESDTPKDQVDFDKSVYHATRVLYKIKQIYCHARFRLKLRFKTIRKSMYRWVCPKYSDVFMCTFYRGF